MPKTYNACAECGARLDEGAARCSLCGTPVAGLEDAPAAEEQAAPAEPVAPVEPAPAVEPVASAEPTPPATPDTPPPGPAAHPATGVYCNQCGWKNPPGARFCSACGTPLQEITSSAPSAGKPSGSPPAPAKQAPRAAPPSEEDPADATDTTEEPVQAVVPEAASASPKAASAAGEHKAVSRQVGIIVGAGVLLVVALFLVTAVSKTPPAAVPGPVSQAVPLPAAAPEGTPLPAELADQAAAIESDIEQLDGDARLARQRDLIALFFGAGRLDRAAFEQEKIAQATGAVDDWKRAGDLFYDWMNTMPQGGDKTSIAGRAVSAYQTVLAEDPDNLDVRTDLATAYLSSGSPMEGVAEITRVLETDPNHLHARFNYGLMLTWINRTDQAIEQFELVKSLVDETSDYYQRADEAIQAIRQQGG